MKTAGRREIQRALRGSMGNFGCILLSFDLTPSAPESDRASWVAASLRDCQTWLPVFDLPGTLSPVRTNNTLGWVEWLVLKGIIHPNYKITYCLTYPVNSLGTGYDSNPCVSIPFSICSTIPIQVMGPILSFFVHHVQIIYKWLMSFTIHLRYFQMIWTWCVKKG